MPLFQAKSCCIIPPVTHRSSFAILLSIGLHSSLPIAIQLPVDSALCTSVRPQRRRPSIHIRCLLIQRGIMNTIYDHHSSHLTPSVYAFHNVVFHLAVVTIRRFVESTFPGIRYSHLTAYLFNISSTLLFSVLPALAIQLVAIQFVTIQIVAIHLCIISYASTSAFAFPHWHNSVIFFVIDLLATHPTLKFIKRRRVAGDA